MKNEMPSFFSQCVAIAVLITGIPSIAACLSGPIEECPSRIEEIIRSKDSCEKALPLWQLLVSSPCWNNPIVQESAALVIGESLDDKCIPFDALGEFNDPSACAKLSEVLLSRKKYDLFFSSCFHYAIRV